MRGTRSVLREAGGKASAYNARVRTLAIGDIHGCSKALDALLALVKPGPQDQIVTLGDYVSRGPDSRGVVDRLVRLSKGGRLVALRGNHEQMMMDGRESP